MNQEKKKQLTLASPIAVPGAGQALKTIAGDIGEGAQASSGEAVLCIMELPCSTLVHVHYFVAQLVKAIRAYE